MNNEDKQVLWAEYNWAVISQSPNEAKYYYCVLPQYINLR